MERVLGIGGYFLRAADPAALGAWYRDCLGLDADENGLWRQGAGLTVFATFESETGYFGSRAQQTMLNFRVRDLDAMLAQLRAKGADVAKRRQSSQRIAVEHANAELRQWRPLQRWTGRRQDYAETHCAIAGLVSDRAARRAARHRPSTELVPAFPTDGPGGLNSTRQDGSVWTHQSDVS